MSKLIDADALEKDGWKMNRIVRVDKNTMEYQTKKPTDFPTIEPEPKWIPCTERLPENKSYVLTTIKVPGRKRPHARSGWYEDGLFMNDNGDVWKLMDIEVKAWMPLPSPYCEEGKK